MNVLNAERWTKLWRKLAKKAVPPEYFEQLAAMYSEPQRQYHNQRHIADCLSEFDQAKAFATTSTTVELAIWFHDAVYDPHAADNEEQSAQLAEQWLRNFGADDLLINAVVRLVLATKNHDGSVHPDAGLMVDIDLSILGRPPERFWEYEDQIRAEYAWVEKPIFAKKRAEVLQGFLARQRIYQTDYFFQKLEANARANLTASVQRLQAGQLK